jgi:hypothetical protein
MLNIGRVDRKKVIGFNVLGERNINQIVLLGLRTHLKRNRITASASIYYKVHYSLLTLKYCTHCKCSRQQYKRKNKALSKPFEIKNIIYL